MESTVRTQSIFPIEVNIQIDNEAELLEMWHRMNGAPETLRKKYPAREEAGEIPNVSDDRRLSYALWYELDDLIGDLDLEPFVDDPEKDKDNEADAVGFLYVGGCSQKEKNQRDGQESLKGTKEEDLKEFQEMLDVFIKNYRQ